MDLFCQRCDEPFDQYHVVNDMDSELEDFGPKGEKPSDRFRSGEGCPCCDWGKKAPKQQSLRGMAQSAMYDIMGSGEDGDEDGVAAMMDEFDYMGMLD